METVNRVMRVRAKVDRPSNKDSGSNVAPEIIRILTTREKFAAVKLFAATPVT